MTRCYALSAYTKAKCILYAPGLLQLECLVFTKCIFWRFLFLITSSNAMFLCCYGFGVHVDILSEGCYGFVVNNIALSLRFLRTETVSLWNS